MSASAAAGEFVIKAPESAGSRHMRSIFAFVLRWRRAPASVVQGVGEIVNDALLRLPRCQSLEVAIEEALRESRSALSHLRRARSPTLEPLVS